MNSAEVGKPVQKKEFFRSVKLVAWSFLGIRGNKEYQQDLAKVNPLHVVVVGVVAALLLVVSLIGLVNWVVAK
ncbi:MAG: hypothetical protein CFE44_22970 [Burkholderiales bacterium PBB4]|nr:MAG: hypothetical protein CFE44_22970 [Burkholderiales bacterium PBB4]